MKTLFAKRGAYFFIAGLLLLLAGCLEDDYENVQPVPVGYVSIYHASPDAPKLDISVDDRKINTVPFSYSDFSGYLNFYTGNRELKFTPEGAVNALIDTVLNVENGYAYSVFVVDQLPDLKTLIVRDSSQAPQANRAMVRFVQLSPDAPHMDFSVTGHNGSTLFQDVKFMQATAYKEVDATTTSFEVKNSNGDVILSASGVSLRPGQFYTIVSRGFANPPAGNTNVLSLEVL